MAKRQGIFGISGRDFEELTRLFFMNAKRKDYYRRLYAFHKAKKKKPQVLNQEGLSLELLTMKNIIQRSLIKN